MPSIRRRHSRGLLYTKNTLQSSFFGQKSERSSFEENFIEAYYSLETFWKYSIPRLLRCLIYTENPPEVFLFTEELEVFYRRKFYGGPSRGLLYTEDLQEVFYTQKTFQRSSIPKRPPKDLFLLRRHSRGFLHTDDLLKVLCIEKFW